MKQTLFAAMLFASIIGTATFAKDLDVDFKAPAVDGISNAEYPELGAIVLDATHSIFYGNIGTPTSPTWLAMGGAAPTVSVAYGTSSDNGGFDHSTGTYTTPAGVLYLEIEMVGGGGGGSGSGTASWGTPTSGGDTTFKTTGSVTILDAVGGSGASVPSGGASGGGGGGSPTVNSPATTVLAVNGGSGMGGFTFDISTSGSSYASGAIGGQNTLGGAGVSSQNGAGQNASANTGAGGGGAGVQITSGALYYSGGGGGAGAYIKAIIKNPASSYLYSVGAVGSGGSAGTSGHVGGNGALGIITVKEYYE